MKNRKNLSRRDFLQSASVVTGSAVLRLGAPALAAISQSACGARDAGTAFVTLGPDEAADFAAIAARIIPTTDTPGANEAGVIYFFDRAFAEEMSDALPFARAELANLNESTATGRFSLLTEEDQDHALREIENEPVFGLLHVMTMFGFFGMSSHGGNKDHVAWDLLGFEGHHGAWQYPYGFYDAEVHNTSAGASSDGE